MTRNDSLTGDRPENAAKLQEDVGALLRRAERGEHMQVLINRRAVAQLGPVDDADFSVDSELMEARIRGAHADPGLRRELDELQPDTLADL